MARTMTTEEALAFIAERPRTAKLATVRPDGAPQVAPVWVAVDGGDVVFTTHERSGKGRAIRRDPRVSLCVDDEAPPFAFVVVHGTATVSEDLDELRRWATIIGGRYMGEDQATAFGQRNGVPGELLVRVAPRRIVASADVAGW